jgi:hypothetical protein
MSRRLRLAGDGRLRVPAKVAFDHHGFLRGRLSDSTVDPFDWTDDRLLLSESFVRLDLSDRVAAKRWFVRHGVVDRVGFTGDYSELPHDDWLYERRPDELADYRDDIAAEQANVLWHLATLERLSERRQAMDWDRRFGQLVIESPDGYLVVGGPDAGAERPSPWTIEMLEHLSAEDPERQREADDGSRLIAETEGWPTVAVSDAAGSATGGW